MTPRRPRLRKVLWAVAALFVAAGVAAAINHERVYRVYKVVTLFDQDQIVENFRSMPRIMPSRVVKRSGEVFEFASNPRPLPASFTFRGETIATEDFIADTDTLALIVIRNDRIEHESYRLGTRPTDRLISWSIAKSVVSALFGIAVADGRVASIGDLVTRYVPELKGSGYEGVTIRNVLQMSSGVTFNEDYGDFNSDINRMGRILAFGGSMDAFAASLRPGRPPGTYHHYVSIDTHVLAMVLRRTTGVSVSDYMSDKLWSKIGPEDDAVWLTDTHGMEFALGGLNMRPLDYARFGRLYLERGNWKGEQVVPAAWTEASTVPDGEHVTPGKRASSAHDLGYGFQWWIPENAERRYVGDEFIALGVYGQMIYVNRPAGVVVVKNSANREFMADNFRDDYMTLEFCRAVAAAGR